MWWGQQRLRVGLLRRGRSDTTCRPRRRQNWGVLRCSQEKGKRRPAGRNLPGVVSGRGRLQGRVSPGIGGLGALLTGLTAYKLIVYELPVFTSYFTTENKSWAKYKSCGGLGSIIMPPKLK